MIAGQIASISTPKCLTSSTALAPRGGGIPIAAAFAFAAAGLVAVSATTVPGLSARNGISVADTIGYGKDSVEWTSSIDPRTEYEFSVTKLAAVPGGAPTAGAV